LIACILVIEDDRETKTNGGVKPLFGFEGCASVRRSNHSAKSALVKRKRTARERPGQGPSENDRPLLESWNRSRTGDGQERRGRKPSRDSACRGRVLGLLCRIGNWQGSQDGRSSRARSADRLSRREVTSCRRRSRGKGGSPRPYGSPA
jgi:hypothetical protein